MLHRPMEQSQQDYEHAVKEENLIRGPNGLYAGNLVRISFFVALMFLLFVTSIRFLQVDKYYF